MPGRWIESQMIFKRPEIYVSIFHKWGLPDFVDDGFEYEIWEGVAIFAHRPLENHDYEEFHMAMDPKHRHRARDAVKYMQSSQKKVVAVCSFDNVRIKNLLLKCGFTEKAVREGKTLSGETKKLRFMTWVTQ